MADHEEHGASAPSTTASLITVGAYLSGSSNPHINEGPRNSCHNKRLADEAWLIEHNSTPPATPAPSSYLIRRAAAEFIATFILVFTDTWLAIQVLQMSGGAVTQLLILSATGGLTVMILVLSTGHISGAHLNPCITLSSAIFKHFPWSNVPAYIGAQMAASFCAAFAIKAIFHPETMAGGVTVPSRGILQALVMEFVISFMLMFVIAAVSTDPRAVKEFGAVAVGGTIALNVLIAGNVSGASMNPARTLGPAVAAQNYRAIWVYFVAPTVGALVGAWVYHRVKIPSPMGMHTDGA